MAHTITSPVARWPGQVVLHEPLSFPQYLAWTRAVTAAAAYVKTDGAKQAEYDALLVPGLLACVETWSLGGGFTPDPFPATPRRASAKLIAWLVTETAAVANAADDVDPNVSPPSTAGP